MSFYSDGKILIDNEKIVVRDAVMPIVGVLVFASENIAKIEAISMSLLNRLTIIGTSNFSTWYGFDMFRPLKTKAIKITVSDPLGPFSEFVFTPDKMQHACKVLKENFPGKFR